MSTALPSLNYFPKPSRRVRVTNYPNQPAEEVVIQSDQVDSGNSSFRTTFLRPACVLVKRSSTGEFVMASDANADHQAAAAVTALVTNPGAGGWDGDLEITGHWGTLTVALSGDDTNAAVAAAIIAKAAAENPESKAPITAVDTGTRVQVLNTDKGDGTWLKVKHATVTTAFGASGTGSYGSDPDVIVTEEYVDMLNGAAVAVATASKSVTRAGHYDAANLINLTAEAAAVLLKRGSRFYGTPTLVG